MIERARTNACKATSSGPQSQALGAEPEWFVLYPFGMHRQAVIRLDGPFEGVSMERKRAWIDYAGGALCFDPAIPLYVKYKNYAGEYGTVEWCPPEGRHPRD
jgi:hypothetical protein